MAFGCFWCIFSSIHSWQVQTFHEREKVVCSKCLGRAWKSVDLVWAGHKCPWDPLGVFAIFAFGRHLSKRRVLSQKVVVSRCNKWSHPPLVLSSIRFFNRFTETKGGPATSKPVKIDWTLKNCWAPHSGRLYSCPPFLMACPYHPVACHTSLNQTFTGWDVEQKGAVQDDAVQTDWGHWQRHWLQSCQFSRFWAGAQRTWQVLWHQGQAALLRRLQTFGYMIWTRVWLSSPPGIQRLVVKDWAKNVWWECGNCWILGDSLCIIVCSRLVFKHRPWGPSTALLRSGARAQLRVRPKGDWAQRRLLCPVLTLIWLRVLSWRNLAKLMYRHCCVQRRCANPRVVNREKKGNSDFKALCHWLLPPDNVKHRLRFSPRCTSSVISDHER